jgi:hypothetical protein
MSEFIQRHDTNALVASVKALTLGISQKADIALDTSTPNKVAYETLSSNTLAFAISYHTAHEARSQTPAGRYLRDASAHYTRFMSTKLHAQQKQ